MRQISWVVAVAAVVVSCNGDVPTAARLSAPDQVRPYLIDSEINTSDTYVAFDVDEYGQTTVVSDTAFVDPDTDLEVTSIALPPTFESQHVEGGYDRYGNTRILQTWAEQGEYIGEAAKAQAINDVVTYYDAAGNPIDNPEAQDAILLGGASTIDGVSGSLVTYGCSAAICEQPAQYSRSGVEGHGNRATKRVERVGDELHVTEEETDPKSGNNRRAFRRFKKTGEHFVIAEEIRDSHERAGAVRINSREVSRYRNVRFNTNEALDAKRLLKTRMAPLRAPAPEATGQVGGLPFGQRFSAVVHQPPTSAQRDILEYGEGQTVVFQHGFHSSSETWARMHPWVTQSMYAIGTTLRPNLEWRLSLETQASDLVGKAETLGSGIIFIGHSQGGLISRRAGQLSPPLAKAVITIGTPHTGVPVSVVAKGALGLMWGGLNAIIWNKGCGHHTLVCEIAQNSPPAVALMHGLDNAVPVINDFNSRSKFLSVANGSTEHFRRFGITSSADGRWKWVRLIGDGRCYPEASCGGRELQRRMTRAYVNLRSCNHWGRILRWVDGARCRILQSALRNFDDGYERLIDPKRQGSDGIVPNGSQNYPNTPSTMGAPRNYFIRYGDSHVGEPRSDLVRNQLLGNAFVHLEVPIR